MAGEVSFGSKLMPIDKGTCQFHINPKKEEEEEERLSIRSRSTMSMICGILIYT